jgi:hypothetical protein
MWALVPLWALAALELARNLKILPAERNEVIGVAALSVLILIFIWLDFLALLQTPSPSGPATLRVWLMFGSLFLLIVSILLVAVGWSVRSARLGGIWGLIATLGIYSFGAMIGAAGLRVTPGAEMWEAGSRPAQADLLLDTIDQMSNWSDNNVNAQPVKIVSIESPALEWLLHAHQVQALAALDPSASPPIVITTEQDDPSLAAGYRGESFLWRQEPLWEGAAPSDWFRWIAFHQMAQTSETVIVWVRSDLFLDSGVEKP